MPRSATVVARDDLTVLRIERGSLMNLTTEHPAIGVAIIGELGQRLHGMNRSLAYLTYAANALGRDEYDSAMLAELTRQPGEIANLARAFANMAAELEAKQRRRDEMQAAAAIQNSILPRPLGHDGALAAIDLHAEMHPAREIGGDFYDYFLVGEDRLAITVADVSGKGIPAALFMAVARTVLRSGDRGGDMETDMASANRLLATENAASMFVTAFHGVLDLKTGAMRYCNAGHNPPYLLRAAGGREPLKATGIPFGVDEAVPYRIAEAQLQPGDTLFLFSDGITEAFDPAGEEFGTARLEAVLDAVFGQSAAAMVGDVLAATIRFIAGGEQSDDITVLALVYRR
jgi:serine phosphatase RsbU (regulator of sigma subunit)